MERGSSVGLGTVFEKAGNGWDEKAVYLRKQEMNGCGSSVFFPVSISSRYW